MNPEQEIRLTKRQARFVEEYLTDFNATQAAVRAGYSKVNAARIGYENLQKVHITSAIGNRQKQLVVSSGGGPERIVKELTKLGFYDVRDLFDGEWNLLKPEQIKDEVRAAITSVSRTTTPQGHVTVKVTLASKLGAMELLGKILGILNPDKSKGTQDGLTDEERIEIIKRVRRMTHGNQLA